MDYCDVTGDRDFDSFTGGTSNYQLVIGPDRQGSSQGRRIKNYDVENEDLLFEIRSSKLRPLFDDAISDECDFCRVTAESTMSQEFPPKPYRPPRITTATGWEKKPTREGPEDRRNRKSSAKEFMLPSTGSSGSGECNHRTPEAKRRYLVSFDSSTTLEDRSAVCYFAERARCLDFWNFVDETPEVRRLIKEGHFEHHSGPVCVNIHDTKVDELEKLAKEYLRPPTVTPPPPPKYSPEMLALREKREKIRKDIFKRRKRIHAKYDKFSTAIQGKIPAPKKPDPCGDLADCPRRDVDDVFGEMEKYDEISLNPVKMPCALRKKIICPEEIRGEDYYWTEFDGLDNLEPFKDQDTEVQKDSLFLMEPEDEDQDFELSSPN